MNNRVQSALNDFQKGYNCAQSVFAAFAEDYGIEKSQAYKLACGVGGGFRFAEVCGAVSGAVMIIGLKYGNSDNSNLPNRDLCYQKTIEFVNDFKKLNGGQMTCKEILGFNMTTPEGKKHMMENISHVREKCFCAITSAIELLEKSGY